MQPMSRAIANAGLFLGGAFLGLGLWWLVWGPLVDLGLLPPAWHRDGDSIVIDDPLSAVGCAIGLLALPVAAGVSVVKTVRDS